ncbi:50S ribosomal protein L18e [Candidatus Micrarchaeota archaeon]|nr:50S ribosomal protein L18e [Candidatus Micrarchaeota archaeon]
MVRRGFENPELRKTLVALERAGRKRKVWKRVAELLSKPTRKRVTVNLSKISKLATDGSTVIVPGKVLGVGKLNKKVTVIAFSMSRSAEQKIKEAGSKPVLLRPETVNDTILNNPCIII